MSDIYTLEDIEKMMKVLPNEFITRSILNRLNLDEEEYQGYNKEKDEFLDTSDAKIVESYKRLIKENITEEEKLITNIGGRIYTWRYAYKEEDIDCAFVQEIYLCSLLEEVFDEASERAEMYLSD